MIIHVRHKKHNHEISPNSLITYIINHYKPSSLTYTISTMSMSHDKYVLVLFIFYSLFCCVTISMVLFLLLSVHWWFLFTRFRHKIYIVWYFILLCGGFWSSVSRRLSNGANMMMRRKKNMCFYHFHRWTLQSATSWTPTCQPSSLLSRQSTRLSMFSDFVNCNSHEATSWTFTYFLNKTFCHFLAFQKHHVDKLTK